MGTDGYGWVRSVRWVETSEKAFSLKRELRLSEKASVFSVLSVHSVQKAPVFNPQGRGRRGSQDHRCKSTAICHRIGTLNGNLTHSSSNCRLVKRAPSLTMDLQGPLHLLYISHSNPYTIPRRFHAYHTTPRHLLSFVQQAVFFHQN